MVVQRAVTGSVGHHPFVPRIAVTGSFVLVLASVGLFIYYIHHVANMIRVATIITNLGIESRAVLERRYPSDQPAIERGQELVAAARTVAAPRPGVLVSVNEATLIALATEADCVLVLAARVGDFVPEGAPLVRIHPKSDATEDAIEEDRLLSELAQDTERTMEQDLAFGFRQLVDIADRALSPATNDPTTACQAVDALHDLLRRLCTRHLPSGRLCDADGSLRVVVPQYRFVDFVDLRCKRSGITAPAPLRCRDESAPCCPTFPRPRTRNTSQFFENGPQELTKQRTSGRDDRDRWWHRTPDGAGRHPERDDRVSAAERAGCARRPSVRLAPCQRGEARSAHASSCRPSLARPTCLVPRHFGDGVEPY